MVVSNKKGTDDGDNGINKGDTIREENIRVQILANTVSCLSALTVGLLFAWTSPFIVKILEDRSYDVTEQQASYLTCIPPIAMILSSPIYSKLSDAIGRKKALMSIALPHVLAWLLTLSKSIYILYTSRFFAGLGDGCLFAVLPMYIGEISTPKVRGIYGNLLNVFTYFGMFLVNVIGSHATVTTTALVCLPLPLIFLAAMSFMPESPSWHLAKGREEEARACLRVLRCEEDIEGTFRQLMRDVTRQQSETGTWRDLIANQANRKALVSGIFLRVSQLLGGVTVFNVYTQYVFEQSGAEVSSEIPSMIYTGMCFVLIFLAGFVVERIGKRSAFVFSILFCGIVLIAEGVFFYIDEKRKDVDMSHVKWLPIAGMLLYIVFCSSGIIMIPTLMLGELFSASIKAKGLSVLVITFGIMIFVSNNIFYWLKAGVGMWGPFVFFGTSNLLSAFLALFLVPETKGKTLEEIQQSLKKSCPV